MDGGDAWTTALIGLRPPNCTLKNGGFFVTYVLSQTELEKKDIEVLPDARCHGWHKKGGFLCFLSSFFVPLLMASCTCLRPDTWLCSQGDCRSVLTGGHGSVFFFFWSLTEDHFIFQGHLWVSKVCEHSKWTQVVLIPFILEKDTDCL